MRARSPISTLIGLSIAASVALAGCGGGTPAAPTSAPAATSAITPAAAAASNPTAAPATPTAAATTGESLKSTVATATPASTAGDSLKPATATPGGSADTLKPAATATVASRPAVDTPVPVRDSLKPIETPRPIQPTPTPAPTKAPSNNTNDGKIKPVTKLQIPPTPVPARKGVANPDVDPMRYAEEMITDLQQLAGAVMLLGELATAYEAGELSEDDLVVGFTEQSAIVRAVYQREVQRDFPPQLKEIDDYYVESLRSASKMTDSLVLALQTGDMKHMAEAEHHAQQFEFFFNELARRLQ